MLLSDTTKAIACIVANIDGRRIDGAGNGLTLTGLDSKLKGGEGLAVPVASFVLQHIVTRSEAEGSTSFGQAVLDPARMRIAVLVTEIETIVEGLGAASHLHDTASLCMTTAVAHTFLIAVVAHPSGRDTAVLLERRRHVQRLHSRESNGDRGRGRLAVIIGGHHLQRVGASLSTRQDCLVRLFRTGCQ